MTAWKLPPKAKIYEALSAVGDDRVHMKGDNTAEVSSSDGSKTYLVEWSRDLEQFASNDNASYWQGYVGYPIVAVLMLLGKLTFNKDIPALLAGIPWKAINKQFRNDYDRAVQSVLDKLEAEHARGIMIANEVDRIMGQLQTLKLEKLPRRRRPPKVQK
jgi:hypothetical protein